MGMAKRYMALAVLASALWGLTYPLTYLALRLMNVGSIITLSYLFSTITALPVILLIGPDVDSVVKGLALSPVNFLLNYILTILTKDSGGIAAVVSLTYVFPVMLFEFLMGRNVSTRELLSSMLALISLITVYSIGDLSLLGASLAVMMLNALYTLALDYIGNYEPLNLTLGCNLGTLTISLVMGPPRVSISSIYYPVLIGVLGNLIPYLLYSLAVKGAGPVASSLTAPIEALSSIVASMLVNAMPMVNLWALPLLVAPLLLITGDGGEAGNAPNDGSAPKSSWRNA